MRKSFNLGKTIAIVIVVLLLLAVVVGLAMYLKGIINKDNIADFIDPNRLKMSVNGINVAEKAGGYYCTDVYPLDVKMNKSNYDVKIIANCSISFDVDVSAGNVLSYVAAGDDLTNGFDIDKTDGGFTVVPKGDLGVILSESFPNLTIDIDKAVKENVHDVFLLVVTLDNTTVKIGFGLYPALTLTLDETEYVF